MVIAGKEIKQRGYVTDEKILAFLTDMERIVENDKNDDQK